jgi:hypothetical protein
MMKIGDRYKLWATRSTGGYFSWGSFLFGVEKHSGPYAWSLQVHIGPFSAVVIFDYPYRDKEVV